MEKSFGAILAVSEIAKQLGIKQVLGNSKQAELAMFQIAGRIILRPDDTQRRDILEIAEDRHDIRSTIIATQFPIDKWHSLIGDPTIADAICNRLIYNAYKLKLTCESMRKIKMERLGMGEN